MGKIQNVRKVSTDGTALRGKYQIEKKRSFWQSIPEEWREFWIGFIILVVGIGGAITASIFWGYSFWILAGMIIGGICIGILMLASIEGITYCIRKTHRKSLLPTTMEDLERNGITDVDGFLKLILSITSIKGFNYVGKKVFGYSEIFKICGYWDATDSGCGKTEKGIVRALNELLWEMVRKEGITDKYVALNVFTEEDSAHSRNDAHKFMKNLAIDCKKCKSNYVSFSKNYSGEIFNEKIKSIKAADSVRFIGFKL